MLTEQARWKAVILYNLGNAVVAKQHYFDELEELQDIVEGGPDFTTIDEIKITYNL